MPGKKNKSDFQHVHQDLHEYIPDFLPGTILCPEISLTPEIVKICIFRREKTQRKLCKSDVIFSAPVTMVIYYFRNFFDGTLRVFINPGPPGRPTLRPQNPGLYIKAKGI